MSKNPALIVNHEALRSNMQTVVRWCSEAGIDVVGVIKVTTGMASVALDYEASGAKWIASSRLEQLARVKEAGVKVPLMMIRVPMLSEVEDMVQLCEYSLQSSIEVLKATDKAAQKHGKVHRVILMTDLGDLREGIFEEGELIEASKYVEENLDSVRLEGIGTNLGCVGSVMPTKDNMQMLAERAEEVERAIGRPLDIVSGGATSSLMPLFDKVMPSKVNNLRIGAISIVGPIDDLRTAYGRTETDVLSDECFTLEAEVIESGVKPTHPIGELGVDAFGNKSTYIDRGNRKRVLLAVGKADYGDIDSIIPKLKGAEVTMASSDHTILDVEDCAEELKVGDTVKFKLKYSAILRLTSSENINIVEKEGTQDGSTQIK